MIKTKNTTQVVYYLLGNPDKILPLKPLLEELNIKDYKVITDPDEIENPNSFLFIFEPKIEESIFEKIEYLKNTGLIVEFFPEYVEKKLKRIPLELIKSYEEYYLMLFERASRSKFSIILDKVFSFFLLVIFSPLFVIISLINLFLYRKIFFIQERVGLKNRIFKMYKFQTLKDGNESEEERVTKIGKFLREKRLDEIPQFINVLKGDMALVGPRPEMLNFHQMCIENIPYYRYRNNLKPGITGWAQVNYIHSQTLEEYIKKTEFDLYYIKNASLKLDLKILFLTAIKMIRG